ncbi:MAG: alpha-amylase family glycosyl hydrolase, partial [bacterium]|nr:alpha-amylase family glycosyl hydrolase [bacterium]
MSENIIPSTASDFDLTKRLGATPIGNGQTQFRVWAPRADVLAVAIKGQDKTHQLSREEFGYHSGVIDEVKAGDAYQYVFPSGQRRPDPAAAAQVADVHGFSRVVAPDAYQWECEDWAGIAKQDLVIYELHIGAFTETGTFSAAIDRLDELVAMGITAIEIMPVAEAPGRWNWGYDGVGMYAVHREMGQPDDMKRFIDACHSRGLAVLLDVVYNHFGPEGNYLSEFGPYFTNRHHTPWGSALNFDGRHSRPVRDFIVQNALYWLREFRLDGLRLDAIHFMFDDSDWKITDEIRAAVTNFEKESNRPIHLIAESNLFDADFLGPFTPESKRLPWDAVWCDDIMHSI